MLQMDVWLPMTASTLNEQAHLQRRAYRSADCPLNSRREKAHETLSTVHREANLPFAFDKNLSWMSPFIIYFSPFILIGGYPEQI